MLSLQNIADLSVERVTKDKDLAIAITGFEGDGKSALSIGLGLAIDRFFDLRRNVLFSPSVTEIRNKIYDLPPYTPIIADEAIKIMYKRNWGSKMQKYLNQIYAVCRSQNKISIFNIPRFTDFDEYFRNHRVKLWIHIVDSLSKDKDEGHAVVLSRSWNPVTNDPWGLNVFEKLMLEERRRFKKDSEYDLNDKLNMFSKMPTFVDVLKFSWIEQRVWDEYLELKKEVSVDEDEFIEQDKTDKELAELKAIVLKSTKAFIALGYKKKQIAELYGIDSKTITSWLNKEKRLKAVKEFNQMKALPSFSI